MAYKLTDKIDLGYACKKKGRLIDELAVCEQNSFNKQLREWEDFRKACKERTREQERLEARQFPDPRKQYVTTSQWLHDYGVKNGISCKLRTKKKSHKKSQPEECA